MAKEKKKKLSKTQKKKRTKKILVGAGIVTGVGAISFLTYKYFTPLKKYFSDTVNKLQGKNENGEELSKVAEFSKLGISERQEKTIVQNIDVTLRARDNATTQAQYDSFQNSIDRTADRTYRSMQPWNACTEAKHQDTSECRNYNLMVQYATTGIYPEDQADKVVQFINSEAGQKLGL